MPARNEPCPCGSGAKYKRCCQIELDGVPRELRQRDAVLAELTDWIRSEHADTLEEANRETTLIRLLRGQAGRSAMHGLGDQRLPAGRFDAAHGSLHDAAGPFA